MTTKFKVFLTVVTLSVASFTSSVQAANTVDVVGTYRTNNETEFNFDLTIDKAGKATYTEQDLMGGGKPTVFVGKWVLDGSTLTINFPKEGRYVYAVTEQLTWKNFGCKGSSFGLAITSTPKAVTGDSNYYVFRKADLRKTVGCKPV